MKGKKNKQDYLILLTFQLFFFQLFFSSFFLLFHQDYVTDPGLGHVTVYRHPGRYPTLFHSPLVGVDKETLATSTLMFRS